jgi:predicted transcriptional regulator
MAVVRIPDDLHEKIKECADAEDRSMATIIRRAFRLYESMPFEAGKPPEKKGVAA